MVGWHVICISSPFMKVRRFYINRLLLWLSFLHTYNSYTKKGEIKKNIFNWYSQHGKNYPFAKFNGKKNKNTVKPFSTYLTNKRHQFAKKKFMTWILECLSSGDKNQRYYMGVDICTIHTSILTFVTDILSPFWKIFLSKHLGDFCLINFCDVQNIWE